MVRIQMSLHPPGFIEPCLPTVSRIVPTGPQWAYEINTTASPADDARQHCAHPALRALSG